MTSSLLLASTSSTRKVLLDRLNLPYKSVSPLTDETALAGELPPQLARRLALDKARAVSVLHPSSWVIGSDQVGAVNVGSQLQRLNKPFTTAKAIEQLRSCSGKTVVFNTAVCLVHLQTHTELVDIVPFEVKFRKLTLTEIKRYIETEKPLNAAGSFYCEGLGITLFDSMSGEDYTALMGLPLIALSKQLRTAGFLTP